MPAPGMNLKASLTIAPIKIEESTKKRIGDNIHKMKTVLSNLHDAGLNYRHIGLVAHALLKQAEELDDPILVVRMVKFADLLFLEGVSRTLKNLMWNELRQVPRDSGIVSVSLVKLMTFEFLQRHLRTQVQDEQDGWWRELCEEVNTRFPHLPTNFTKLKMNWATVLNRFTDLSGVRLSPRILKDQFGHEKFSPADIISFDVKTSSLYLPLVMDDSESSD